MEDILGNPIINRFTGPYAYLSNFFLRPIVYKGIRFESSEHAYQWEKTHDEVEKNFVLTIQRSDIDPETKNAVIKSFVTTPAQAKKRGTMVTLREDWEIIKIPIMAEIDEVKFTQHKDLTELLLSTDHALLIEGNHWHDNFWGSCTCGKCESKLKLNNLGKIHMKTREKLRQRS